MQGTPGSPLHLAAAEETARLTLGVTSRTVSDSPLVWPLNWGPTVMYAWKTGCSWTTTSRPKVVAIWRWVDVCLKMVMLSARFQG